MVDIERDQYGRPLLPHPISKKRQPWTRATTLASTIQDRRALEAWSQRNLVKGFVANEDLLLRAAAAGDDRGQLDTVINAAQEAARAKAAADKGTAVHALTEKIDRGEDVTIPRDYQADIDAYTAALRDAGIKMIPEFIETMTINPDLEAAGTPDRIVTCPQSDLPVIFDLKGLALDTPIPTPDGWTTMGAVAVDDEVFGSDGQVCRVTHKSAARQRPCYRIEFDDATSIVCDNEHRWRTIPTYGGAPGVRTTAELRDTLINPITGQRQHRVFNAGPLDLPDMHLAIDPYVLGVWLGDGKHTSGEVCKPDNDLWIEIQRRGWTISADYNRDNNDRARTHTIYDLRPLLRQAGLLGHKHIPDAYLRASVTQRLDLLRGLMDTDGTWNRPRKRAVFNSTDKALSHQVVELARSLGERAVITSHDAHGFGLTVTNWVVQWTPTVHNPFALPRKRDLVVQATSPNHVSKRRLIMSVEPTLTVPTQCIAVDSPDHTYLCGEQMVPTHNTGANAIRYGLVEIAAQLAIYAAATHYYDGRLHELPDLEQRFGIVLHLPAGTGEATLHTIDLVKGRQIARLCHEVRAMRKTGDLAKPLNRPFSDAEVRRRVDLIKDALKGGPLPQRWPDGVAPPSRQTTPYDAAEAAVVGTWCVFVEDELNLTPF